MLCITEFLLSKFLRPQDDAYLTLVFFLSNDPYEGESFAFVIEQVADPIVNKRPDIPQDCPEEVQNIMTRCMDRNPEERPTFATLHEELKSLDAETIYPKEETAHCGMDLLLNEVFPPHVAHALKAGRSVETENHDLVTIIFTDIVSFCKISSELPSGKIADMLNRLYLKFDELSRRFAVHKMETIGDSVSLQLTLTMFNSPFLSLCSGWE